jgi:hypothetical protein
MRQISGTTISACTMAPRELHSLAFQALDSQLDTVGACKGSSKCAFG